MKKYTYSRGTMGGVKYIKEFTVVLFIVFFVKLSYAYRFQQIILYSEIDFSGKSKSFTTFNLDLEHDSIGKIAKSHCIVRGLWKIAGTFDNNPNLTFVENAFGADKDQTGTAKVCGTWNSNGRSAQYKSIEYIGSSDLDTPALSLNTRPRFLGNDLYFDGNFLRLPTQISFHSYGFTGKENWTLFENSNFTGPNECLAASVDQYGHSMIFNVNKTFLVGSIWRGGCGPKPAHSRGAPDGDPRKGKPKPSRPSQNNGQDPQGRIVGCSSVLITLFVLLLYPFAIGVC